MNLQQLLAINDELLALVRAGVPLHTGMVGALGRRTKPLARLSRELQQGLSSGQTLERFLAERGDQFPPIYTALVQAGMRSGNPASAFEAWSHLAQQLDHLRRVVRNAALYPLMVLTIGCLLASLLLPRLAAEIRTAYGTLHTAPVNAQSLALDLLVQAAPWLWLVPILVVLTLIAVRLWPSDRRTLAVPGQQWMRWVPQFRRLAESARGQLMCQALADLVAHDVPLVQALPLAVRTAGTADQVRAVEALAERMRAGENAHWEPAAVQPLPIQLVRALRHHRSQQGLVDLLRRSARFYRQQAERRQLWLSTYLPIILIVGLGVSAAVLFTVGFMAPWSRFLLDLTATAGTYEASIGS